MCYVLRYRTSRPAINGGRFRISPTTVRYDAQDDTHVCLGQLPARYAAILSRGAVYLQVLFQVRPGMDAVPVRIRLQEGPVNRHPTAAQQGQLTAQQNELPVGRWQRSRIVLAKVSNCLGTLARGGPLAQPDHFQVAMRLGFQPARTSYPVLITVQVQFQQQSRDRTPDGQRRNTLPHAGIPTPPDPACRRTHRSPAPDYVRTRSRPCRAVEASPGFGTAPPGSVDLALR